jgi:hypothetical protein
LPLMVPESRLMGANPACAARRDGVGWVSGLPAWARNSADRIGPIPGILWTISASG